MGVFKFQNFVVDVEKDYYDFFKTAEQYRQSFLDYILALEEMANKNFGEYEKSITQSQDGDCFKNLDAVHDNYFGYGVPYISIYDQGRFVEHFNCIPEEYELRLNEVLNKIYSKFDLVFASHPEMEKVWEQVRKENEGKFVVSYEKSSEKNIKRHLKEHYDNILVNRNKDNKQVEEVCDDALQTLMKNKANQFILKHLSRIKENTVENFTTPLGIKLRSISYKLLKQPLKIYTCSCLRKVKCDKKKGQAFSFNPYKEMVLDDNYYPKLEKDKAYIFVPTHRYTEDVNSVLGHIDRDAYLLFGSSEQLQYNPQTFAVWAWGMIYVNRLDTKSKQEAMKKLEYLLNRKTSVIIWVEGKYDNTENLLCGPIAESAYVLSRKTGAEIVPVCTYFPDNSNQLITMFGDPIALGKIENKQEAQQVLRDTLATMNYHALEKYSTPLIRSQMDGDIHLKYMEERKKEYLKKPWYHDVWDEELHDVMMDTSSPQVVRESLDKVLHNPISEAIPGPTLIKRREDQKYDFKAYMKKNWKQSH